MTIAPPRRRRCHPDELRSEAVGAARDILERFGPAAITLQSVAGALGMAHGSITHHFGTAANLQAAVADDVIGQLLEDFRRGVRALRAGDIDEAGLVDLVFDTFAQTGVGRLIGWLAATDRQMLEPLFSRFSRLPSELAGGTTGGSTVADHELPALVKGIVSGALSASLIGDELDHALGLPRSFAKRRAARELSLRRGASIVSCEFRRPGSQS